MPERPASRLRQNASFPIPTGETTPTPVITTRGISDLAATIRRDPIVIVERALSIGHLADQLVYTDQASNSTATGPRARGRYTTNRSGCSPAAGSATSRKTGPQNGMSG